MENMSINVGVNELIASFVKFYDQNKFDPALNQLNDYLLNSVLKARGYNNFQNNFESGETFFIEKVLAPIHPKLCIDIGANVGDYTQELLQKTSSKVISFEPLVGPFEELKNKVRQFSGRSTLENKGVGSENKNLIIHFNPNASAHASFSEEVKKVSYVSNEMKQEVEVVTLDRYCVENSIEHIDFIKIDTEGFESEVFLGAQRVFKELKPKFIQMEFNWHQLFRNASLNYFSELLPNYDVYQLVPNGWIKRDSKDPFSNIYLFSNFVFVMR
jgi:FkbM family methyltransferase